MELVIHNDLQEINKLTRFVDQFVEAHGLPNPLSFQINLALEELITNIISYGYSDAGQREIRIALRLKNGRLITEVEDDARAFNPLKMPPPDLDAPLEERKVGGLGIHLVKNMFDTMDYRREDDKNKLVLMKDDVAASSD